jgi:hypothetical protein
MNIAIIIASLVLGASDVGPPTDNSGSIPGISAPTDAVPLEPQLRKAIQKDMRPSRPGPPQGMRPPMRNSESSSQQPGNIPHAPTDNGTDTEQPYRWLPPTAESPEGGSGSTGGRPMGFYGPSKIPYSPTHARPGQAQSNTSMRDAQLQRMRIEATSQSAMPSVQPTAKAFAGTPMNTGGVSPYMNLFRTGNSNGTIDNYSTLVRPQLEQRRTNQQFNTDINGLEANSRVQGLHIQQLNRDTHNLQGVKAQQYFMNYGDYYQNSR